MKYVYYTLFLVGLLVGMESAHQLLGLQAEFGDTPVAVALSDYYVGVFLGACAIVAFATWGIRHEHKRY